VTPSSMHQRISDESTPSASASRCRVRVPGLEAVDTWYVRLSEQPDLPSGRVVLEVLRTKDGEPDSQLAQAHGA
jgi:hypothetical protein